MGLLIHQRPATILYRDDFAQPEAAPLASPHNAPGGGTATINGVASSIENGVFKASTPDASAQGFTLVATYTGAGLALIGKLRANVSATEFGVGSGFGGMRAAAANDFIYLPSGSAALGLGAWGAGVFRGVMVVRGGSGETYFVDLDTRQLLFVSHNTATGAVSPFFKTAGIANAQGDLDYIRIRTLGAPWSSAYGLAMCNVTAPSMPSTQVGVADAIIHVGWTVGTGETLNILFRRVDDDNTWILRCAASDATNPSTMKLIEKVAGVETERNSVAETLTVGQTYTLMIRANVASIQTWKGGTNGVRATYASATFNQTEMGVKVMNAATVTTLKIFEMAIGRHLPRGI